MGSFSLTHQLSFSSSSVWPVFSLRVHGSCLLTTLDALPTFEVHWTLLPLGDHAGVLKFVCLLTSLADSRFLSFGTELLNILNTGW